MEERELSRTSLTSLECLLFAVFPLSPVPSLRDLVAYTTRSTPASAMEEYTEVSHFHLASYKHPPARPLQRRIAGRPAPPVGPVPRPLLLCARMIVARPRAVPIPRPFIADAPTPRLNLRVAKGVSGREVERGREGRT